MSLIYLSIISLFTYLYNGMANIYHISQNLIPSPNLWEVRCVDGEAKM